MAAIPFNIYFNSDSQVVEDGHGFSRKDYNDGDITTRWIIFGLVIVLFSGIFALLMYHDSMVEDYFENEIKVAKDKKSEKEAKDCDVQTLKTEVVN